MWPIQVIMQVRTERLINLRKYRFTKNNRVKSKKNFQHVYTAGRSVVDDLAVIYIMTKQADRIKIGLAVGKKLGTAVTRNHTKRMMREVFRKKRHEINPGTEIIWVARKKLITADYNTFERVFVRLIKRAGLLNQL